MPESDDEQTKPAMSRENLDKLADDWGVSREQLEAFAERLAYESARTLRGARRPRRKRRLDRLSE